MHTIDATKFSSRLVVLLLAFTTASKSWYVPRQGITWNIQYSGKIIQPTVELFDLDMFDTSAADISRFKKNGTRIICYFSAGSSEDWRPDYAQFKPSDMGKSLSGWPGERWLNVKSDNVRRIMTRRISLSKEKGCDGIDPDNVDGYANNNGLNLTAEDQLNYNMFLADVAHGQNLSISLKNDLDQVKFLEPYFDFTVNEQCYQYKECGKLQPFINSNKAVLEIEYKATLFDAACASAKQGHRSMLLKHLNLDGFTRAC